MSLASERSFRRLRQILRGGIRPNGIHRGRFLRQSAGLWALRILEGWALVRARRVYRGLFPRRRRRTPRILAVIFGASFLARAVNISYTLTGSEK